MIHTKLCFNGCELQIDKESCISTGRATESVTNSNLQSANRRPRVYRYHLPGTELSALLVRKFSIQHQHLLVLASYNKFWVGCPKEVGRPKA